MDKVIHYCWFGKKDLPGNAKKCILSWEKFLPGYKIIRWDESNFDVSKNPYTKEAYEKGEYAFVSDYARLKTIYDNGGIYFDTDVELIRPLDAEMLKTGFFAKEDKNYINTGLGFAAERGDKTIKAMLDDYNNIHFIKTDGTTDKTSCPIRNTESIKTRIERINNIEYIDGKPIYPKEYFSPLNWRTGRIKRTKNTFAIHYGNASWVSENIKIRLRERRRCVDKYGKTLGLMVFKAKRILGVIK